MKAVVVGAGIGGLSATIALRRAGIEAHAFERAPELRHIQLGGGIHLWHNGMRGLQQLELGAPVSQLGGRGAVVERAEFTTSLGAPIASWSVSEVERELGAPTVGVRRPDLHRVLIDALDDHAVTFGATCTGFQQNGDGVIAHFSDGRTEPADVLIGADGLKSAVRVQLRGQEAPRFAGYASWQALAPLGADVVPIGLFRVVWGRGARFLYYRVNDELVYWEGIFSTEPGGKDAPGTRKQNVVDRFAGWQQPVATILEATPEEGITRGDIYDRPPVKEWGSGRVMLLGDAAHPMTNALGQGANQAIEDAVILAKCLTRVPDPAAGLREYQSQRVGRANRMAQIAWMLTQLSRWQRPRACMLRDRTLRLAFSTVLLKKQKQDMAFEF
jgi:2-polyprenyl-6-methoxyphenol hydroxylase-like FAD-dependent oxidoreductase